MSAARLAASTGAGKELPVRVGGGLWGGGGRCWLLASGKGWWVQESSISIRLLLHLFPIIPKEVPTVVSWMTGGSGSLKKLGGYGFCG